MYWFLSWRILLHLWVLVLDETAVALDPFLVAVFAIAAETVMVAVVFVAETVVVAAVVSSSAVWVHHVWSAHQGRLLQSSSAFSLCG